MVCSLAALLLQVCAMLPDCCCLKFAGYAARDTKKPFVTWLVSPSSLASQMKCFPLVFSLLICLCSTYQNRSKQCNGCYVSMIIKAMVLKLLCKGLSFLSVLRCVWKQLGLFLGKRSFGVWTVCLIPGWKIPTKASFLLSGLNSSGKLQSRSFGAFLYMYIPTLLWNQLKDTVTAIQIKYVM